MALFTGSKFGFGKAAGGGAPSLAGAVSGGTLYTPGDGYAYHLFTFPNSDSLVTSASIPSVEVLIVAAGGGGGGGYYTGGGGAGGVVHGADISVGAGTYAVSVGEGGTGSPDNGNSASTKGTNSAFNSVTALGGGNGASGPGYNDAGGAGGSGGGSGYYASGAGAATPQPVPADYIAYGTVGRNAPSTGNGGGGSLREGGNTGGIQVGVQKGGDGRSFSNFLGSKMAILTPLIPVMGPPQSSYGGGGGGGNPTATPVGASGGYGGGGNGAPSGGGGNAPDHLGGGGGGCGNSQGKGGNGGPGCVIVRYSLYP